MPAKSKAQFRFMKAVEAGDVKGKNKPTKTQAKEFTKGQSPKNLPEKKK
jgi:hypothetical protein